MRCSSDELRCYDYTLDGQWRNRDVIVVYEMFNGEVEMLSLYIRCSTNESRCYRVVHEMFNGGVKMLWLYIGWSTEESRGLSCLTSSPEMLHWYMNAQRRSPRGIRYPLNVQLIVEDYRCYSEMVQQIVESSIVNISCSWRSRDAIVVHEIFGGSRDAYRMILDVQRRSRDAIVVHEMFNERVEMLSLYMRCSKNESRCSSESVSSSQSTDKAPLWDYVTRVSKAVEKGGFELILPTRSVLALDVIGRDQEVVWQSPKLAD
ncbi:hypothetical protein Tco_0341639 [Tanacetum coccineum]